MAPIQAVSPTVSGNDLRLWRTVTAFSMKGMFMKQPRLNLYRVDIKLIRNLAHADDRVMSVSPQIDKSTRPFIGVIVVCKDKQYCIPLSSPKEKHKTMKNDVDFMKVFDGDRLIAVLNFNEMIPVRADVIQPLNMRPDKSDDERTRHYKKMTSKQLAFCQKNQDAIVKKANRLYDLVTTEKASFNLRKRCCDFLKLESVLARYRKSN